jgi:hypothetical protein
MGTPPLDGPERNCSKQSSEWQVANEMSTASQTGTSQIAR